MTGLQGKIWRGGKPVDADLKKVMLGQGA